MNFDTILRDAKRIINKEIGFVDYDNIFDQHELDNILNEMVNLE
jgi:hypothetical protein